MHLYMCVQNFSEAMGIAGGSDGEELDDSDYELDDSDAEGDEEFEFEDADGDAAADADSDADDSDYDDDESDDEYETDSDAESDADVDFLDDEVLPGDVYEANEPPETNETAREKRKAMQQAGFFKHDPLMTDPEAVRPVYFSLSFVPQLLLNMSSFRFVHVLFCSVLRGAWRC